MQFGRTTKWLIGILAFLLAGILLMGCGDEGDDTIESALYPVSHVAAAPAAVIRSGDIEAGEIAKIFISVESESINIGDKFQVSIDVKGVTNLKQFNFDLHWTNPAAIGFVTVTKFREIFGNMGVGFQPPAPPNQEDGVYADIAALTRAEDGFSGNGNLLSVLFRAKAIGKTQIRINNVVLLNTAGAEISTSLAHLAIDVIEKSDSPQRMAEVHFDVNGDGAEDFNDLTLIVRHLNQPVPTDLEIDPDINDDGFVDMNDYNLLLSYLKATQPVCPLPADLPEPESSEDTIAHAQQIDPVTDSTEPITETGAPDYHRAGNTALSRARRTGRWRNLSCRDDKTQCRWFTRRKQRRVCSSIRVSSWHKH